MSLHEDKVELLRKVDIFSELREYELDIIAKHSEAVKVHKRDIIFRKDGTPDEMYILASGRVGILSLDSNDDAVIAEIAPGESFGELDMLGNAPRSATAVADEDSELIRFPSSRYSVSKIFQDHPYISAHMLYRMLGITARRISTIQTMVHEKTPWLHELRKQLMCDKQTGLYNRVFLNEDLSTILPLSCATAAFLMIKPDNFKEVNDVYGHSAGDHALHLMAIFLQSELGENDFGIRYRGDEFAAVLPDVSREEAMIRAEEISAAYHELDLSSVTGGNPLRLTVSIGIAVYPDEADETSVLAECAHKKMFRARDAGGSRIEI